MKPLRPSRAGSQLTPALRQRRLQIMVLLEEEIQWNKRAATPRLASSLNTPAQRRGRLQIMILLEGEINLKLEAPSERMERDKGIEPSPRPWQGRVLPLYESRSTIAFIA